ncbi:hypothetical protein HYC85_003243 [Camellia sinensis]|uniref:Uncharacterized protein n=1 Tax=Camellia sinensis TaxID=4442 RepID=A0A7J7IC94_CAMSI|nr:hypothetical protein HYC85_003243 [Camellia sinensis]
MEKINSCEKRNPFSLEFECHVLFIENTVKDGQDSKDPKQSTADMTVFFIGNYQETIGIKTGWGASTSSGGPLAMLLFASVTFVSTFSLCHCYRSPGPGPKRNPSYLEAVRTISHKLQQLGWIPELILSRCMGHNRGWEEAASMFSGTSIELKTCDAALLEATGKCAGTPEFMASEVQNILQQMVSRPVKTIDSMLYQLSSVNLTKPIERSRISLPQIRSPKGEDDKTQRAPKPEIFRLK